MINDDIECVLHSEDDDKARSMLDFEMKRRRKKEKTRYLAFAASDSSDEDENRGVSNSKKKSKLFRNFSKNKEKKKSRVKTAKSPDGLAKTFCFGTAISSSLSKDGRPMVPTIVKDSVDYLAKQTGYWDQIYLKSGNHNQVEEMKAVYDKGYVISFKEYSPLSAASLLTLFFKELPEPIIPKNLYSHFEDASDLLDATQSMAALSRLLNQLPPANRLTIGCIIGHCHMLQSSGTRSDMASIAASLLKVSEALTERLISLAEPLFPDDVSQRESIETLREELGLQEALLANLHLRIKEGAEYSSVEEELWEVQRIVTSYKRRIRHLEALSNENPADSNSVTKSVEPKESISPTVASAEDSMASLTLHQVGEQAETETPDKSFNMLTCPLFQKLNEVILAEENTRLQEMVEHQRKEIKSLESQIAAFIHDHPSLQLTKSIEKGDSAAILQIETDIEKAVSDISSTSIDISRLKAEIAWRRKNTSPTDMVKDKLSDA